MLVYLDESYREKERLYLGALFLPSFKKRQLLHQQFLHLKRQEGFLNPDGSVKEVKYSKILTSKTLRIAKSAVELFSQVDNVFFRACTVPYDQDKMDKLGGSKALPVKIKEAIVYTKATVQLLSSNLSGVTGGVLLMDELTRSQADKFDQLIRHKLSNGLDPMFRYISYVDSGAEANHTIQICDLLLGVILNEAHPSKAKHPYKNKFREFVKKQLNLPTLKENYWKKKTKTQADKLHPKYNIRFWETP